MGNVRGLSVVPWAMGSPWGPLHTVEAVTVGGYEAARLVQQGIADTYVISANNRMYVLSHFSPFLNERMLESELPQRGRSIESGVSHTFLVAWRVRESHAARRAAVHALTWDPGTSHLPTTASECAAPERQRRITTGGGCTDVDAAQVKPANSGRTMCVRIRCAA
jgi:hypothetical protein